MPAKIQSLDMRLADEMAACYADPLRHVMVSYPWDSGPLAGFKGPDKWQVEFLEDVGQQVLERGFNGVTPVPPQMHSTASGHGIGKSAIVAWLIRWILDTRPDSKGVVTANTVEQLRTKTWAELAKWHRMSLTNHWYRLNAGGSLNIYHMAHPETWRCDAQTCEERNSEAFAGLHAANSTAFFIFDEASAIPDKIFETREGGSTDGEPMVFDFGNPTRNTGRFHANMVGQHRHRFTRRFIDSRDVAITNKALLQEWIDAYGEDSDFVRVRIKGQFPRAGSMQFISTELIEKCIAYSDGNVPVAPYDPVVISCDVARFGDDRTVIRGRRGRDCTIAKQVLRGADTMQVAARVVALTTELKADAVFIDGGGVGGGVVDRCRQLGIDVVEVNFGERATDRRYANMAAQCWGNMREAMEAGILIEDDPDLRADLVGREYSYDNQQRMALERKQDMKKRGLASPDDGDALALSFAYPVAPTRLGYNADQTYVTQHEYDPYA